MKKPTPKPTPKGKDWTEAPSSIDFGKRMGVYQNADGSQKPKAAVLAALKKARDKAASRRGGPTIPASPTK
jgi:hypothetical protein